MDKILREALQLETKRQQNNIELIASENFVSKEVLTLQGSILTNKYAEGYPKKDIMVAVNISIFSKKKQLNMPINYLDQFMLMCKHIQAVVPIWLYIKLYLIMATKLWE